jgi:alpha-N-arabinofuranosidase
MAGEIIAAMEFKPLEPLDEAGLSVYQSPTCQYALFISLRGGQKFAILRKTVGDMETESSPVWITSDKVWLKISFDTKSYRFSIAEREGNWKEAGSGLANLVSTDVAGTFGGVVIGPYATGNGKSCKNPADFDWVEYSFKKVELSEI